MLRLHESHGFGREDFLLSKGGFHRCQRMLLFVSFLPWFMTFADKVALFLRLILETSELYPTRGYINHYSDFQLIMI